MLSTDSELPWLRDGAGRPHGKSTRIAAVRTINHLALDRSVLRECVWSQHASGWTDPTTGTMWLFGGEYFGHEHASEPVLNDLWRLDVDDTQSSSPVLWALRSREHTCSGLHRPTPP